MHSQGSRLDRLTALALAFFGATAATAAPLAFEPNLGQTGSEAAYLARTSDGMLFLTPSEIVLRLDLKAPADGPSPDRRDSRRQHVIRIQPVGALPAAGIDAGEKLASSSGYFRSGTAIPEVPHYGRVVYRGLYPQTDLVVRGESGRFAYDFVVGAGADPAAIALRFEGAGAPRLEADGSLSIDTPLGPLHQSAPVLYQEIGGEKVAVAGGFELRAGHLVGFQVGAYDRSRELVIDPTISFTTCVGSIGGLTGSSWAKGIETTANGQAYLVGTTEASDFPVVGGAQGNGGGNDAFVVKLDLAGNLSRATYFDFGGDESGESIDLDAANSPIITGTIWSGGASQAFAAKLSTLLDTVLWTKTFGGTGNDIAHDVALDASGNVFLSGATYAADFCTTLPLTGKCTVKTTLGGDSDAYLVKLLPNGGVSWATLAGTGVTDVGTAVAVDDDGRPYLGGYSFNAGTAVRFSWVRRFAAAGTSTSYTFNFGQTPTAANPTFTEIWDLAVDSLDNAYFVGTTNSTAMEVAGAVQPAYGGGVSDAFVGMLNNSGTALVYNTFLGGPREESGDGIRVGDNRNAYVAGRCEGKSPADAWCTAGNGDTSVFVARYATGGLSQVFYHPFGSVELEYTYGLALDSSRNMYVAGLTYGSGFDGPGTTCDLAGTFIPNSMAFAVKVLP